MDDEFEDALSELFGDGNKKDKRLGRLLLMLSLDRTFSSPILVKQRLGYDTDWTYNCFRRLKRAGIMYGDKIKAVDAWKDGETGTIAFILDTLTGLGEIKKLRDGRYAHKDWIPKKPMLCKFCGLKDDAVKWNYCKTDLRSALPGKSTDHIRTGTKHSWVKSLRGGIEAVEPVVAVPKVNARSNKPKPAMAHKGLQWDRGVKRLGRTPCRVATGIPAAEKLKPDMEKLIAWWKSKTKTVDDIATA